MNTEMISLQKKLSTDLAEEVITFASDVKPTIHQMAACVTEEKRAYDGSPEEMNRHITELNNRLNKFVGKVTSLYLATNPRD